MSLEIETPVAPESSAPESRAELKALTSHLQGVILPGDSEAEESDKSGEIADSIAGVKMPKSLKDTLALLAEVQAERPKDKNEATAKELMLEKVTAHLHAISQGPSCKPISLSGHMALAGVSSDHAEDIHLTMLCRTDRIVAKRLAENQAELGEKATTIERLEKQAAKDGSTIARLEAQIAELTNKPV